jgi:hypothetical protein
MFFDAIGTGHWFSAIGTVVDVAVALAVIGPVPLTGCGLIRRDTRFKCIQRSKFLFIAQLVQEAHRQALTI